MTIDFNDVGPQRSFEVIPDGTIVPVELTIRQGGAGEGGWLRRSKNGDCVMLDGEFTVLSDEYAKRKFWSLMVLDGSTSGHKEAGDISNRKLRAMVDSAHGFKHEDKSEEAKKVRTVTDYAVFDGLRFWVKVGVDPARDEYKAKNTLDKVITPDDADWQRIEQAPKRRTNPTPSPGNASGSPDPLPIGKPAWAK